MMTGCGVLRVVSLEDEEILWELPWNFRELRLRGDGLYGFSFNYQTESVDILDIQTGQTVGEIHTSEHTFGLTEDWNWITFTSGSTLYRLGSGRKYRPV